MLRSHQSLFEQIKIISQKSKRSKLETIFRKSRTTESRNNFKSQAKLVANLISSSKRTYFKDLILRTSKQPKKLWSTLQSLFSLKHLQYFLPPFPRHVLISSKIRL